MEDDFGTQTRGASKSDPISGLEQEMKLLSWHKVANDAALKAALIRTKKLRSTSKDTLHKQRLREKALWMRQIIEEEQQKPLHVNQEYVRKYEERERVKEEKLEKEVWRHIRTLKSLKAKLGEREQTQQRNATYRRKQKKLRPMTQLEAQGMARRSPPGEEPETTSLDQTADGDESMGVMGSLDKLVELERRISALETDASCRFQVGDSSNNAGSMSRGWRKKRVGGTGTEPAKTLYSATKRKGPSSRNKMTRHERSAHINGWLEKRAARKQTHRQDLRRRNQQLRRKAAQRSAKNNGRSQNNFKDMKRDLDKKREQIRQRSRVAKKTSASSRSRYRSRKTQGRTKEAWGVPANKGSRGGAAEGKKAGASRSTAGSSIRKGLLPAIGGSRIQAAYHMPPRTRARPAW